MEYFPFVSIFGGDAYETPLGRIPVAKALARELSMADPLLKLSDCGHIQNELSSREHALEVQLPFLQTVLRKFDIVPIVMGDQSRKACRALGDSLGAILERDNVVVVVSSDLSHFYPYAVAKEMDGIFLELLKDMEPWRLYESVKKKSCEACGAGPVISGLVAAQNVDGASCHVLSTANSGDVTGDRDRVVGYACAAIFERDSGIVDATEETEAVETLLSKAERVYLLARARDSIETALGVSGEGAPPCESPFMEQRRGVFVTLKVRERLRGCVGTTEPRKPVRELTADMAVAAATGDRRFNTLKAEELDAMHIEISVLSSLRKIRSPEEIEIGRHGLVIVSGGDSGLLLPQVAKEHEWDAIEFLGFASEKAGLTRDAWKEQGVDIYVFTATVFGEEKELTH
jgi:AmmeMemoRadiSam system protein B/AmmeMemoRadiSam system protein A